MFCPQCGSGQGEEMKFCNKCGANLFAVRQVVASRETDEKFDWSKTWMAEMFLSKEEQLKRKADLERQMGITPEVKRHNEIKGGIITSCAGVALMIFLNFFMRGIILGAHIPDDVAEILSRIWIAGIFPFFVGLGLIINGLVVSKKLPGTSRQEPQTGSSALGGEKESPLLRSADTSEFIPTGFSVTEGTTKHLNNARQKSYEPNNH